MPHAMQIRQAAGLNYIDVYHRTRYYPQPLAFIPGLEGAGTIEAVVQDVRSGSTVLTIQPTVYRSFP